MDLAKKRCVPCEGGTVPLFRPAAEKLVAELPGWQLSNDAKHITKDFSFKDFAEALAFVNRVGEVAEAENHHPNVRLGWGKVAIDLSTHAIGGLSENDFILAAKIDNL